LWINGFPLVHNATLCPDLGYFYQGNDVQAGADRLMEVIDQHDAAHHDYRARQRALISRYLPDNAELVGRYAELLDDLMTRPAR
jgi:hypothetical protein